MIEQEFDINDKMEALKTLMTEKPGIAGSVVCFLLCYLYLFLQNQRIDAIKQALTEGETPSSHMDEIMESSMPVSAKPVYVLVIAHPDDESLFFLPTVRYLVNKGERVWFLCLTNGNYDGLGSERETELEKAGRLLGAKVIIRNDKEFQDHPTERYDKEIVAKNVLDSLANNNNYYRFVLITFDEGGVSGHVNHTDVHYGVKHLMEEPDKSVCISDAWYLKSESNLIVKYFPFMSWVLLLLSFFGATGLTSTSTTFKDSRIVRMHDPRLNWKAMATHKSQFVWYRRLFVVFSCYTYYNKLTIQRKKIPKLENGKN